MVLFFRLILTAVTLTFMVLKVESVTDQQFQVRKEIQMFVVVHVCFILRTWGPNTPNKLVFHFFFQDLAAIVNELKDENKVRA